MSEGGSSQSLVHVPAGPPRRQRAVTKTYDLAVASAAITGLEAAIGGRDKLVGALLAGKPSDELGYVIGLIADPRNDARQLAEICATGGVTIGELLEAYKSGVMATAQVKAIVHVAEKLPDVVQDAMTRAAPHWIGCDRCQSTGTVVPEPTKKDQNPTPEPCRTCRGQGQILVYPDLERQQFAVDLGGLIPKKAAAPLIDLSDRRSMTLMPGGTPGGMTAIVQAVDQLLYRRGGSHDPVSAEAEVTDAEMVEEDIPAAASGPASGTSSPSSTRATRLPPSGRR